MDNDFAHRIKKIEQELTDLKTASLYTSIKNTTSSVFTGASTGLYKIEYKIPRGEPIVSQVYSNLYRNTLGGIYARTPQGSTQIIEINTTYAGISQTPTTFTLDFVVVSNFPVTSITRIN